ncbi:hypothetical protein [Sorangium sp. So ce131]|uniref:hypothetical protein n=1 Tax=Sorangium sp. So ce131 TaxID=3133282 RepID=UPI003F5FE875
MRLGLSLSAVTAMCLALAACGDDGEEPQDATSGSGGAGGEGGVGGPTGEGGTGGQGGAPGGGKADGEPCTENEECSGGICLTEEGIGWAGGYCSALCAANLAPCEDGSVCLNAGEFSLCVQTCTEDADCEGPARICAPASDDGTMACFGGCSADDQCETACNDDQGTCSVIGEACDNAIDDDEDGLQDCEELDCSPQGACAEGIAAACAEATDVSEGGTFSGSTEDGTNLFAAVCSDAFGLSTFTAGVGAKEKVFRFVAPAKGNFSAFATATAGDFDWYFRSSCDDASTLMGCLPIFSPGDDPAQLLVDAGDTFFIFIDDKTGEGADYTLEIGFVPQVCGDGEITGSEECDDGNEVDDDACTNTCARNLAPVCAEVILPVEEPELTGDTSEGAENFIGSCGGSGAELVYRYTPAADGPVSITATPVGETADLVLYARTECADVESELGCVDDPEAIEAPESITVEGTAGEPIDIFVDSYSINSVGAFTLSITEG